jgi:molybdopterin/thiamine biosynthesis adenylyltransferase
MSLESFLKTYSLITSNKDAFRPIKFKLTSQEELGVFESFLSNTPQIITNDNILSQIRELIKLRHPGTFSNELYQELLPEFLEFGSAKLTGTWVYYPWNNHLIHVLNEAEFIEVRTNRNKQKITAEEQQKLSTKTIGVIGLSVGQSVALTLCMERVCGTIKLADFDELELSNLNRLRTGLQNLGQKKTIIAAREIAEIDPYLNVEIFSEGVTHENMDDFFAGIDLLVEVCDGLEVKINSRLKARDLKIPVVMDTNDRGMLDIERFDLEPTRPILHGLVTDEDIKNMNSYTPAEKMAFIFRIISIDHVSEKLKLSMEQINKTITSWPQLASSVVLGGAATTDVIRRIFLNQLFVSGRFYIDFDEIIKS